MTLNLTPADAVTTTRQARNLAPGDLFVFADAQDRRLTLTVRTVADTGSLAFGSETNRMLSVFFSDAPAPIRSIQLPEQQQCTVQLPSLDVLDQTITNAQRRAMAARMARDRVSSALSILREEPATSDVPTGTLQQLVKELDATASAADRAAERAGDDARTVYLATSPAQQ